MSVASDLGNFKWAASEPSERTIYERPEPNDGWQIRELVEPVPEPTTSFRRGPRGEENVGNGHGAYNIHSIDRVQYIHYDEWLSSGTSPLLP